MAREAALLLTLAGLAGASWALKEPEAAPLGAVSGSTVEVAEATDTVPIAAVDVIAASAAPSDADRARLLELPDGTFVPTLNDAVDAAPLLRHWGPSPWSPIIGVERSSAGVDWYRHADGSYSTTQMVWRSDLQRRVAMTRVAHPGPAPAAIAAAK